MKSTKQGNALPLRRHRSSSVPDLAAQLTLLFEAASGAWDVDTSHASCISLAGAGLPHGQCYVTSMLIADHLMRFQPHVSNVVISRGRVRRSTDSKCLIEDHGWVEFILHGNRYLCDFTLHQSAECDPIILAKRNDVTIEYSAQDVRSLSEVSNLDVWVRYWILSTRPSVIGLCLESRHA